MIKEFVATVRAAALTGLLLVLWSFCSAAQAATTLVSIGTAGEPARSNSYSTHYSFSADGTKVAFESEAINLISGDTNVLRDIFVRDLTANTTTRVSVDSSGNQSAGGASTNAVISSDGTKVAFCSTATNLVSGDTNGKSDVFLHDMTTGVTTRMSVDSSGNQADGGSFEPSLSGDGTKLAFMSQATNLVSNDINARNDVFVRELTTNTIVRASVANDGSKGNNHSYTPSLNNDGTKVAFISDAGNMVTGDSNGAADIFLRDLTTNKTVRVSVDSNGIQGNRLSGDPCLSSDGTKVAFYSVATNLVSGDTNNAYDVFLRDLTANTTTRVSVDSDGNQGDNNSYLPNLSRDGTKVAFCSMATNLDSGDTNNSLDVFARELATGVTRRISLDSAGNQGIGGSFTPSMNGDGTKVAYYSGDTKLVTHDTNNNYDVFVSDIVFPPSLSISDASVTEGNAANGAPGAKNATFTVTLSAASAQTVTVQYATTAAGSNSATADVDYVSVPLTTLTFVPGQTTESFDVPIIGDTLDEANEQFAVNLSSPTNAPVADGVGIGTIVDDDASPALTINNVTVTEGNSGTVAASFTVTLSAVSNQPVTVHCATATPSSLPATAGSDYEPLPPTALTFAPGETSKIIVVQVYGDTMDEDAERFVVNLSDATNATIADPEGFATINDDDAPPSLRINDVLQAEGNSGTTAFTFTVSLSVASGKQVTVNCATANPSAWIATAGVDYQPLASTKLTFAPGETSKAIMVLVNGDTQVEGPERFMVKLSSSTNAGIADSEGFGTITNDDVAALVIENGEPSQ